MNGRSSFNRAGRALVREVRAAAAEAARARDALQDSERRQHALLLHMSDLLVVLDADGGLQYASPSAMRILGYREAAPLPPSVLDAVPVEDRVVTAEGLARVVAVPGPSEPFLARVVDARGSVRTHEVLANNLLDDPAVRGIVVVSRDVTDRQQTERADRAQSEVLELIAAEAPLDVVLTRLARWVEEQLDATACSVLLTESGLTPPGLRNGASPSMPAAYVEAVETAAASIRSSPCAAAVAGGAPVLVPDLLADDHWELQHPLARACAVRACWSFPVTSPATGEVLGTFALYARDPGLPGAATEALIARASHLVGIAVDRHSLLARLAHQAQHDALTGLPNRVRLLEALTAALDRSASGAGTAPVVVFLDLDRLKIINDSLGHEVGDDLLVSIATRLRGAAGDGDLVARFGGDEFVVLSTRCTTEQDVTDLVERVLDTISEVVTLEGRTVTPAASAGVVVATPGQTASEVLRDADIAMYRAKNGGGSGYARFGAHMRQRAYDRLELEAELRDGIENGQLRVHFQPVVDLGAGDRIVGFEALARWQHPVRGLLGPSDFIDLAEETGLILVLGEQVLRTAVAAAHRWQAAHDGSRLVLSVNVSAQQLASPRLLDAVRACIAELAPWRLALELTESTLMDDTPAVRIVVDALAAAGARLSIDDFGTGYSSLAYLTRLPVTSLKIDRGFVAELVDRPRAATVAAAINGLGHELGLVVVAEGVETVEQRDALHAMGCRFAQGFLFGHPVPAEQVEQLLRDQASREAGS